MSKLSKKRKKLILQDSGDDFKVDEDSNSAAEILKSIENSRSQVI